MSINYAEGSVIKITQGAAEVEPILHSAASRNQLLLLDFTVSWCGPCRMLAPVLVQLAAEFQGRLIVAKMDCEQSAANQAMAASSAISAYPTMKLYARNQVVETIRGANPAGIRQAIERHLALLGPSQQPPSSSRDLATALAANLLTVKNSCSQQSEFVEAAKTLAAYVGNIVNNPTETKYKKIKLSNAKFMSALGSKPGGKECLLTLGFKERMEAMEAVLMMDEVPAQLQSVLALLQAAIVGGVSGSGSGPSSSSAVAAIPPTAASSTPVSQPMTATTVVDPPPPAAAVAPSEPPPPPPARRAAAAITRRVLVTPAKLARVLESILVEAGIQN